MYHPRVFLIGFGFVLFGLIGSIGNVIFIPIVLFKLYRYKKIRFLARDLVRYSWFFYLKILRFFGIIAYSFSYKHHYRNRLLIIANHPSLLDVVFLLAYIRHANCVVKASLQKNIFLRFAIRASGYISNGTPEEFLSNSIRALDEGESLIIFPEGTRTEQEINFHKAASYLAINGADFIEMLYIENHQCALKKGQKWNNMPKEKLVYKIYSLGEKKLPTFEENKPNTLRVRALHQDLNQIYKRRQKEINGTANSD